jgi:Cu(I)/Ag(I) efflux system membrane fusion protein
MKNLHQHTVVALGLILISHLFPSLLQAEEEKEILYWVAPMDPNYRRDKEGKSPMGMELVPVYADGGDADVVSINPVMVQNLGVRTAKVERGKLWRRIDTVGYVTFDEDRLTHIHLRTSGWIEKLYVKSNGVRVKKGELLFKLYSRELVNAQEEYLQSLRGNSKYLTRAAKERLEVLGMSMGQINEVAKKRVANQLVRVYAKQDGVVHALNVREGMFVKPSTELMTLVDLSSVWLLVDVFERQSEWVKEGQPTEVTLPYLPSKIWEGAVAFVYPTINPKTRTLQVRLQFDNPDELLKPNMYADVKIYAGPKNDVLSIPREALIQSGDQDRVILALGDGKFRAQEVTAGMESGELVEIVTGLKEKDRIVISGQFLIDSEASLKASFTRMDESTVEQATATEENMPDKNKSETVTSMGKVNKVMLDENKVNLSHEAIEALGWPEMTMDFKVKEGVDLEALKSGQEIHFTLEKADSGNYEISQIHIMN